MINIAYWQVVILFTFLWISIRVSSFLKNRNDSEKSSLFNELKFLLVYFCLLIIIRIVYFPWHHVNGHIGPLVFNSKKIIPMRLNLIPFIHLFDIYSGSVMNIIGNIVMFIPVGIIWPMCFKNINKMWKTILAGFGLSLFIELSQFLFYERCSDVDDLLLNTFGVVIGAIIYFGIKKLIVKTK